MSQGVKRIDRSGTITAGGVSQVLMVANGGRQGFWVQNQSAGDLWIDDTGSAEASQPSLRIPSGALYENPVGLCPVTAIAIFGATTGQAFAAGEF